MMELRPELRAFAEAMEAMLREHDERKGDSWKDPAFTMAQMRARLGDELLEFDLGFIRSMGEGDPGELVDVAEFVFFMWWRLTHPVEPPEAPRP